MRISATHCTTVPPMTSLINQDSYHPLYKNKGVLQYKCSLHMYAYVQKQITYSLIIYVLKLSDLFTWCTCCPAMDWHAIQGVFLHFTPTVLGFITTLNRIKWRPYWRLLIKWIFCYVVLTLLSYCKYVVYTEGPYYKISQTLHSIYYYYEIYSMHSII